MSGIAHDLLLRKLQGIAPAMDDERAALAELPIQVRDLPARTDLVTEGEIPTQCCFVMSGIMIRYKVSGSGERQIVNLHVPGDIPDLQSLHLTVMDHHLASLTPVRVGLIPHDALRAVNAHHPRLAAALWRVTLIDASLLRERIVSLGQRPALERLAHLLCETFVRLKVMGLTSGNMMFIPITQVEMADMLGLSNVHMNRTVQELRARGLMVTDRDAIVLPDWERLASLADFDPRYLHLESHGDPDSV